MLTKSNTFRLFEVEGEIGHESQSFITTNPFGGPRNEVKLKERMRQSNVAIISDFDHDATHTHQICMHLCIYKIHPNNNKRASKSTIVQVSASRCPSICERIIASLLLTHTICTRLFNFLSKPSEMIRNMSKSDMFGFFLSQLCTQIIIEVPKQMYVLTYAYGHRASTGFVKTKMQEKKKRNKIESPASDTKV